MHSQGFSEPTGQAKRHIYINLPFFSSNGPIVYQQPTRVRDVVCVKRHINKTQTNPTHRPPAVDPTARHEQRMPTPDLHHHAAVFLSHVGRSQTVYIACLAPPPSEPLKTLSRPREFMYGIPLNISTARKHLRLTPCT